MAAKGNRVISLGAPKEAALYYEEVFPFDFSSQALKITMLSVILSARGDEAFSDHVAEFAAKETSSIPFDETGVKFSEGIVKNLLPRTQNATEIYKEYLKLNTIFHFMMFLRPGKEGSDKLAAELFDDNNKLLRSVGLSPRDVRAAATAKDFSVQRYMRSNISIYENLIKKVGFIGVPTWTPSSGFRVPELFHNPEKETDRSHEYAVALHNLNMIDIEKVSWDAIIELRRDRDSIAALRDFRLFFTENFEGKSPSYVSDKLQSIIYNQEEVSKFWGFETVRKTVSVAASHQNLAGTSILTLAPLLAGAPAPVAAAAGAIVTLTNCALEFGQIYVDKRKADLSRPLRYVTRLERLRGGLLDRGKP